MDYTHLLAEIKRSGMTVEEVAKSIGMGATGLYAAMRNDSLKANKLLAICELLGIPLDRAVFGLDAPRNKGYIEDRVADLERRVENIEAELKSNQTTDT